MFHAIIRVAARRRNQKYPGMLGNKKVVRESMEV